MSYESFLRDALTVPQSTNPAHVAAREVLSLRDENTTLRVKNKFLREKAGYFRDDIEDGAGAAEAVRLRGTHPPHDISMRIAEAVRKDMRTVALAAYRSGCMLEDASEHIEDAMLERDLTAVVAKALEVGT